MAELHPAAGAPAPGRTYLLLIATTILWGGTAVSGKFVLAEFPPITIGVIRYGTTALLLGAVFWRTLPALRSVTRNDLRQIFWAGILGAFLNHIAFFLGLYYASAAHASILPSTISTPWTLVLAARLGRERIRPGQIAGILLCFLGVVLVVRPDHLLGGLGRMTLVGDALLVICGICWGSYQYLARVIMRRIAPVATLVLAMAVGSALLVPLALLEHPWAAVRAAHALAWSNLAYVTLVSTVLAFWWWSVGLGRLGAGRTAIFSNLIPVFGVLLAWIVLGERLSPIQLIGAALAVTGVVVVQRASRGTVGQT
jgi:drug/metabolite transporter (DMT)-like permease